MQICNAPYGIGDAGLGGGGGGGGDTGASAIFK